MVRIQTGEKYHSNPFNKIIQKNNSIYSFIVHNGDLIMEYLDIFYFIINRYQIISCVSLDVQKIDITLSDLLKPLYEKVI